MLSKPSFSKNPRKIRFGGEPIGVVIPLILAPNATASKKRILRKYSCVIDRAIGRSKIAVVEFDNAVPSTQEASPSAEITPLGFCGKREKNFLAMIL